MNRAEMDFHAQDYKRCVANTTEEIKALVDSKVTNVSNQKMVMDFIMENRGQLSHLLRRIS